IRWGEIFGIAHLDSVRGAARQRAEVLIERGEELCRAPAFALADGLELEDHRTEMLTEILLHRTEHLIDEHRRVEPVGIALSLAGRVAGRVEAVRSDPFPDLADATEPRRQCRSVGPE